MARFLFWNINNNPISAEISAICDKENVDILILAESNIPEARLLKDLNARNSPKFTLPLNPSEKLAFFVRYPSSTLEIVHDDNHLAMRALHHPLGREILIAAVHLPSKLWESDSGQAMLATRIVGTIQQMEKRRGHTRTVVVGDFNMDPFQLGIVSSEGFHAVMDRKIAKKRVRKVLGEGRPFLYNPMWSTMGDDSEGPPGSYFRRGSTSTEYFWRTFDQVLVRPDLVDVLPRKGVRVLTESPESSFVVKQSGRPRKSAVSDHLPLCFDLEIER